MTLSIQHQSEASADEWRRVWQACEYGTFFQSIEWAQVWEKYSRGQVRPSAKLIRFSDGREAILPLCFEHKLHGLLDRYVFSP
ncbi:MAG TPA: hypothetical protein VG963_13575, partial [Polyangiaceae bacterium]|nr:hypothetical protein [Polyangiaceae bacterium]